MHEIASFKIVNDTECEVVYFDTMRQMKKYVRDHGGNLMACYRMDFDLTEWREFAYYGGR